jgi:glucoamylase
VEGNAFASRIGKTCNNCATVAPQILCFQQTFWNTAGYVVSNINVNNGRTGKDGNSILTSIHNFDPAAGCDDSTFQP